MKIYALRYYGYEEQNNIGLFDNIEDLAQAVEKIVAEGFEWGHKSREEILEKYGIEIYDLNTTYEQEPDGIDPDYFFQNNHE